MEPVILRTKNAMPQKYKPPPRNMNPKLWGVAKKEFVLIQVVQLEQKNI